MEVSSQAGSDPCVGRRDLMWRRTLNLIKPRFRDLVHAKAYWVWT